MSVIRLYVDEDAEERAVVAGLRRRGLDVLTTSEAHRGGAPDPEQLAFAVNEQRAIYTFNIRHFPHLHRNWLEEGRSHYGIVVVPSQRYSIGEKIRRLIRLTDGRTAEEFMNCIEFL